MLDIPPDRSLFRHARLATIIGLIFTIGGATALSPTTAGAQDREAPSQALATDPAAPYPSLALTADPVGFVFAEYTARFEAAVGRAHALYLEAGYRAGALSPGVALELGYHLFVLGDGLEGPFLGPAVGAGLDPTDPTGVVRFGPYGAIEAGYQIVLGALCLALTVGAEAHVNLAQGAEFIAAPRVSISVGYVLR